MHATMLKLNRTISTASIALLLGVSSFATCGRSDNTSPSNAPAVAPQHMSADGGGQTKVNALYSV